MDHPWKVDFYILAFLCTGWLSIHQITPEYSASQCLMYVSGPPQRVLSGVLHSFLSSGRASVPFRPVPVPALGLSEGDKQCIRDRGCIMARHILADQPKKYIQTQVKFNFVPL